MDPKRWKCISMWNVRSMIAYHVDADMGIDRTLVLKENIKMNITKDANSQLNCKP